MSLLPIPFNSKLPKYEHEKTNFSALYYATLTGYSKDILGSLRPLSRTVMSEPFRVDLIILGLLVLDVSIQNM